MFMSKHYPSVDTNDDFVQIDRYAFFASLGAFLLMHVGMIVWLLLVPLSYRRHMQRKDEEYRLKNKAKKKRAGNHVIRRIPMQVRYSDFLSAVPC